MSYPEEASTAEMVNYTVQAQWSYGNMKTCLSRFFIIIPRVTSTPCHHPYITELYAVHKITFGHWTISCQLHQVSAHD